MLMLVPQRGEGDSPRTYSLREQLLEEKQFGVRKGDGSWFLEAEKKWDFFFFSACIQDMSCGHGPQLYEMGSLLGTFLIPYVCDLHPWSLQGWPSSLLGKLEYYLVSYNAHSLSNFSQCKSTKVVLFALSDNNEQKMFTAHLGSERDGFTSF